MLETEPGADAARIGCDAALDRHGENKHDDKLDRDKLDTEHSALAEAPEDLTPHEQKHNNVAATKCANNLTEGCVYRRAHLDH